MSYELRAERTASQTVDRTLPRPEYPRPQMVRRDWLNLNGEWEFAFDDQEIGLAEGWQDGRRLSARIIVPFAYQYPSSGIDEQAVHEVVWYARSFTVPDDWLGCDLLLRFGAVDYESVVWMNGQQVGRNQGGHTPFEFDISPFVRHSGENRITVRVVDRQDPCQPRGKQSCSGLATSIDYYCTTGLWQTVWIEPAPQMRISDVQITPRVDTDGPDGRAVDALDFRVYLHAPALAWTLLIDVLDDTGEPVASDAKVFYGAGAELSLVIPNARRWSPGSPSLYDIRIQLVQGETVIDEILTYAGIRAVTLSMDGIYINGERVYQKLILDQGYWPEGGMTAPTDAALRADVEWILSYGYNGARKHQKVEDPRWLYWCDRMGVLVWGEMANARDWSIEAEEQFIHEWERAIRRDFNHPCVIVWVPLNESWGVPGLRQDHATQYAFVERIVAVTRRHDLTRPVIDNDGWEHTDVTDILAIHDYTATGDGLRARYAEMLGGGELPARTWGEASIPLFSRGSRHHRQPVMLTEIGGLLLIPENTSLDQLDGLYQAYGSLQSLDEYATRFEDILHGVASLTFLSGFCWTQLTDIEQEKNGLLTYDRKPKLNPEQIAEFHRQLFPS